MEDSDVNVTSRYALVQILLDEASEKRVTQGCKRRRWFNEYNG